MAGPDGGAAAIRAALAVLAPQALEIRDDSAQHAGHAGARDGGGHFSLEIESEAFRGKTRVARHRQIYAAVSHLMGSTIHALAIEARVPGEDAGSGSTDSKIVSPSEGI